MEIDKSVNRVYKIFNLFRNNCYYFKICISYYIKKTSRNTKFKTKTVGDIAGYATSMPELLTIGTSSFSGLISASIVNVISSNVINLIQYVSSIF